MPELDERMRDLKNELQSFEGEEYDESHKQKAVDALKRMENWNLFSDTQEVCHCPLAFIFLHSCLRHLFAEILFCKILKVLAMWTISAK